MFSYLWACTNIMTLGVEKNVTDLGCKRGDGMMLMSYFADRIRGVDFDPNVLHQAKRHEYFCEVVFDQVNLNIEYHKVHSNIVTCFEVLEHLKDPHLLLSMIDCEVFLFSLPFNQPHRDHISVFTNIEQVKALVSPHFKSVQIFMEKDNVVKEHFDSPHRFLGICRK